MSDKLYDTIKMVWEEHLLKMEDSYNQKHKEVCSQLDVALVVGELTKQTLELLVSVGSLYYARKSFLLQEKVLNDKIEKLQDDIKEILENYGVDPNVSDAVLKDIMEKISKL